MRQRPPSILPARQPTCASSWLAFGVLRRPHGVRGEVLLAPYNGGGDRGWSDTLPMPVRWVKDDHVLETAIVASRPALAGFLIRLHGMDTREAVAELVGGEIHFPRQKLTEPSQQEFYVEDVVGCDVHLENGRRLGRVAGTFWNGAHDVMSIIAEDGEERLLPVVPGFVLHFDAGARRLTVDMHE